MNITNEKNPMVIINCHPKSANTRAGTDQPRYTNLPSHCNLLLNFFLPLFIFLSLCLTHSMVNTHSLYLSRWKNLSIRCVCAAHFGNVCFWPYIYSRKCTDSFFSLLALTDFFVFVNLTNCFPLGFCRYFYIYAHICAIKRSCMVRSAHNFTQRISLFLCVWVAFWLISAKWKKLPKANFGTKERNRK